jgi:hypothetical protein
MKADFMECYYKARMASLTSRNIRSAWKRTRLWPVNMDIPLANPRLLPDLPETHLETKTATPSKDYTFNVFQTPRAGKDVRKCADKLRIGQYLAGRDQQRLLRKVSKALDVKNAQLADQELKILSLQHLVERLQPKRRTKVVPNAGQRFVMLPEIIQAQERAAHLSRLKHSSNSIDAAGFDEICD